MTAGAPDPAREAAGPPGLSAARLDAMLAEADQALAAADRALAEGYPGPRPGRQPVHTVYLPADRFGPGLAAQWGRQALTSLETWAPGPAEFGQAMELPDGLAADVRPRVLAKLAAEPIEDLRLDFEDGYHGADEDADARSAAACLADEAAAASAAGPCAANPVLANPVPANPVPANPVQADRCGPTLCRRSRGCAARAWSGPPASGRSAPWTCSWVSCSPGARCRPGSW